MDMETLLKTIAELGEALRGDVADAVKRMDARCDAMDEKLAAAKKDAAGSRSGQDEDDLGDPTAARKVAADSERIRSDMQMMQRQLNDLTVRSREPTQADKDAYADAQAKCDVSYRSLGEGGAPAPMRGEALVDYMVRLHHPLKKHSKKFKGAELATIARDPATFNGVCDSIRADAFEAGMSPVGMPEFVYREIKTESPGGHKITSFVGNGTFVKAMSPPVRKIIRFQNEPRLGRPGSGQGAIYPNA